MKALKYILIVFVSLAVVFITMRVSQSIIEKKNLHYVEENPIVVINEKSELPPPPTDIDRMISHVVEGTEAMTLSVPYANDFTIYEDELYVTNNEGKTWLLVPDDHYVGYARISDYVETISESNVYATSEKIAIVYGGRGSENISIIRTDTQSSIWSVGTISQTATHDLQSGYDELYIDFLEDGMGYIVAVRDDEILAYRSVNNGVTWDNVGHNEELYRDIVSYFGL